MVGFPDMPGMLGGDKKKVPNIQNIRKLYDSFAVKDMTFEDFAKEFVVSTDPELLKKDLQLTLARRRAGGKIVH